MILRLLRPRQAQSRAQAAGESGQPRLWAQEQRLQAFLDRITQLSLDPTFDDPHKGQRARRIARAQTLVAVRRLDPIHKGTAVRFLYVAGLIGDENGEASPLVYLHGADLRDSDLHGANLAGAYLCGAILDRADLSQAFLGRANLGGADLIGADLRRANLTGANLVLADLKEADFLGADLTETKVIPEQLAAARNVPTLMAS
jgi:uncharacterized protein YjbI with pentapeptide repeats